MALHDGRKTSLATLLRVITQIESSGIEMELFVRSGYIVLSIDDRGTWSKYPCCDISEDLEVGMAL